MYKKIADRINEGILQLEKKMGTFAASLILAFILLCIAAIYVTPALLPRQLGGDYSLLSVNPFDFTEKNNMRLRILTPLLAYCLGLRGSLYIIFPLIISLFFMSAIYLHLRKSMDAVHGVLIMSLICFSSPILFLLHFQGYVDVTSYLLFFLIIIYIQQPLAWIPLLALLLLNHDSNLFITPGIVFMYCLRSDNKIKAIIYGSFGLLIAMLPFYFYRNYVNEFSPVDYDLSFYLSHISENINSLASHFYIGAFYSFKLFWLLPAYAVYYYWKEKNTGQLILYFMILACVLAQLLVASDTSRLIGLAFPVIIWSAVKVREIWGNELFLKRMSYLILLNFFIPQFYVGQSVMIRFYSLPSSLILKHFFGIETWQG